MLQTESAQAARSFRLQGLLTPLGLRLSLLTFGLSFVFPVHRFGLDFCPIHHATGLPCPGCGMTRALALMSRGQVGAALELHPFVVVAWPLLALLALGALLPTSAIEWVKRVLDRTEPWLGRATRAGLWLFGAFGAGRLLWFLVRGESFP